MLRLLTAIFLSALSFVSHAAEPKLVATIHLSAPPTQSRISADGKRFVTLLQAKDQQPSGLQVIDTSDIKHPKLRGFLPIAYGDLAISDDGKTVLLLSASENEMFNQETKHEIIALDLTDLDKPKELWHRNLLARKVIISPNANAYAFSALSPTKKNEWITTVVFDNGEKPVISIKEDEFANADMHFSPHANFLVYDKLSQQLIAWDLRSASPKSYQQEDSGYQRYDCIAAVLDDGYIVVNDTRLPRFGIYEVSSGIPRVSTLPHGGAGYDFEKYCHVLNPATPDGEYTFEEQGYLWQFDFHNPKDPRAGTEQQSASNIYPEAVAQNYLFSVASNSDPTLYIYDLSVHLPEQFDWKSLAQAHDSIIAAYNADRKAAKPVPFIFAVSHLEEAGVLNALDTPLSNISSQKASEILNDYAFLGTESGTSPDKIERALRRSIELDPQRKVAQLNLADFLKNEISLYSATGKDAIALKGEIKDHYRAYLKLGGKMTPSIEAFINDKETPESQDDTCSDIARYTNVGRLGELVSGIGTNILFNGKRIDLVFTTEGTAHVPDLYGFDSNTDFPLKDEDMPNLPDGADKAWGGDELGLLTYQNKSYILYYRDLQHPISSISLSNNEQCVFTASATEKIGPKATDRNLCTSLEKNKPLKTYTFDGDSPMNEETIEKQWTETTIQGTHALDFANNGKAVNVAQLEMSSGAGAGCDETFYEVVNSDGSQFVSGPQRDLLMQLQGADPSNRYPILPCENQPRFFSYKTHVYFETKPGSWPPQDNWNQYHRVTIVNNGSIHDVCDFKFETSVSGKKADPNSEPDSSSE